MALGVTVSADLGTYHVRGETVDFDTAEEADAYVARMNHRFDVSEAFAYEVQVYG